MISRYDFLLEPEGAAKVRDYPATRSIHKVVTYMKRCLEAQCALDVSNFPEFVTESAVVHFSQNTALPIIVGAKIKSHEMRVIFSHKDIFWVKDKIKVLSMDVICFYDVQLSDLPYNFRPLLILRKGS